MYIVHSVYSGSVHCTFHVHCTQLSYLIRRIEPLIYDPFVAHQDRTPCVLGSQVREPVRQQVVPGGGGGLNNFAKEQNLYYVVRRRGWFGQFIFRAYQKTAEFLTGSILAAASIKTVAPPASTSPKHKEIFCKVTQK